MARTPTTTDAFNAVSEATRRQILNAIGDQEVNVSDLVERLGLTQPQVSKHLGVLREVGLVLVRTEGRHRWYRINGPALKPIHDWLAPFTHMWNDRLDRLDDIVAELTQQEHKEKSP
jgi:DNA-binding transcriptional ArsR family regulator